MGRALLALGANAPGRWGDPRASLARALKEMEAGGIEIVGVSHLYKTEPVGGGRQPHYLNAVVAARCAMAPAALLRLLKSLEQRAGRRTTAPSRPRPLDLDILDLGGRRLNWSTLRERGRLILPHPLLHTRAFVLVPLLEVAPGWSHPVLGRRAKALLAALGPEAAHGVRRLGEW
jgi:2-amino-4-hydroxy-6-hydroxymethyldihydropteridine diphosphokinase